MKLGLQRLMLILLIFPGGSLGSENAGLGRLFFTPEQRATLDRLNGIDALSSGESRDARQTINGEIWHQAGRRARWINGQQSRGEGIEPPDIPVGDSYHPDSGKRDRLLGDGRLIIRRIGKE